MSVMSKVLMDICPAEEITPKLWFVCPEAQASFVFNFYSYPIPPPPLIMCEGVCECVPLYLMVYSIIGYISH